MDYTSFLHPRIPDLPREASTDKIENLREEIEGMVRDNAAQTDSTEESGTPTEDTSPSPGLAPRLHAVTRANPRYEGTEGSAMVCEPQGRGASRRTVLHLLTARKRRTATGHKTLVIRELEPGHDYPFDPSGRFCKHHTIGRKTVRGHHSRTSSC